MPTTRSTDGTEIAYEVAGEGPVDLLFLHGWAGSGRYFQKTAECLDKSRTRVVTFDFRGHGDSGRADSGYTLDQLADDALAVADAAGSERFAVVGYSMSGKFAQYVAVEHPDRVLGQVLVAGCPRSPSPCRRSCWRTGTGARATRSRWRRSRGCAPHSRSPRTC